MAVLFKNKLILITKKAVVFFVMFLLWATTLHAQQVIFVSGILAEDTHWNNENTYIVTETVRVLNNVLLHIGPGTVVKFNQGRGLSIEGGRLRVEGSAEMKVQFTANHSGNEIWNWSGIVISSVNANGMILIEHAYIEKANIGLRSIQANNQVIRNSHFHNNRNIGVSLVNSSFNLFENNLVTHNYLGMEVYASASGNKSSNNIIRQNKFSNLTTNIILYNDNHGACPFNVFEENLITGGMNGLWLFNSSVGGRGNAIVNKNIFYNIGTANDGYAVYNSMDSITLTYNIFANNHTAVEFLDCNQSYFANNNIYGNRRGVIIRPNARSVAMVQNTFTGNSAEVISFGNPENHTFGQNNIFGNRKTEPVAFNHTTESILIAENFWRTTAESEIQMMLYDQVNNPALGKLVFEPPLFFANTQAPVSAPQNFYVQLVDDQTRLTWRQNPENDLLGYRIFYGLFSDYTFSDSSALIFDTVFFFPGTAINDDFAIAAYDIYGLTLPSTVSGHKSPYAFAIPIPYSGRDTTICSDQLLFAIENSTLPLGYDSLFWETSGDGTYLNAQLLNPVYLPGDNDFSSGSVKLSLHGRRQGRIFSHSFNLNFANPPQLYAGENQIIAPGSVAVLNASAPNSTHVVWHSSGDGVFGDVSSLQTTYTPGSEDVKEGVVHLFIHAFSPWCGEVADTVKLVIREMFKVEGRVWANNKPLSNQPVIATLLNEDIELPARAITFSDANGIFRFGGLYRGDYVLFSPADCRNIPDFLPTYHASANRWQDAYVHQLEGDTYEIDIHLSAKTIDLPMGVGEIAGHFSLPLINQQDFDVYCSSWFGAEASNHCENGLSNVSVLLFSLSRQIIYAHTLTDAYGNFRFENLPFGTYLLEAEIAGYESVVSEFLLISPMQESIKGIEMNIEPKKKINIQFPQQQIDYLPDLIYPNPARDFLMINSDWLNIETVTNVEITNVLGIPQTDFRKMLLANRLVIDVSGLSPAWYMITIKTPSKQFTSRFIKF